MNQQDWFRRRTSAPVCRAVVREVLGFGSDATSREYTYTGYMYRGIMTDAFNSRRWSRRTLLGLSLAAGAVSLTGCGLSGAQDRTARSRVTSADAGTRVGPSSRAVQQAEEARPAGGKTVRRSLVSGPMQVNLGSRTVHTWGYGSGLPGPILRSRVGDRLKVIQRNRLDDPTTTHFHGLALRNDADGVPGLTQAAIEPGESFTADFRTAHPGTYWYHSHVGVQRDRGLYGALIIEDPHEPMSYDEEWVLVLDDWLDGIDGRAPSKQAQHLAGGSSMPHGGSGQFGESDMPGMPGMSGMSSKRTEDGTPRSFLGGDAGDVTYPVHVINGRDPMHPDVLRTRPGRRVRLRVINAAGDTAYRIGVPGTPITLTHTDGFPVRHQQVDAVVLGMGERIDALVTVPDESTPVVALAEGKAGRTYAVLSTGRGDRPTMSSVPKDLTGAVIQSRSTVADASVQLADRPVDQVHALMLTGGMRRYDWGINGRRYNEADPFATAYAVRAGQRVRIDYVNHTMMWHPMHLHGHTFQVGPNGPRKDTVIVKPMETVSVYFDADNPGQWLTHCHNAYHANRGMMAVLSYLQ